MHRLMQYTAYLARTLKPQSVRQYLNFVALIHKEYSLPNPLLDNWHLHSLLKGISRVKGCQTKPKQPMTISILLRLYRLLNLHSSLHCSFWAICLVGFFGMFRKSHMVSTSSLSFDSSKQFTKEDFQSFSDHVRIRVKSFNFTSEYYLFLSLLFQAPLCAQFMPFNKPFASLLVIQTSLLLSAGAILVFHDLHLSPMVSLCYFSEVF